MAALRRCLFIFSTSSVWTVQPPVRKYCKLDKLAASIFGSSRIRAKWDGGLVTIVIWQFIDYIFGVPHPNSQIFEPDIFQSFPWSTRVKMSLVFEFVRHSVELWLKMNPCLLLNRWNWNTGTHCGMDSHCNIKFTYRFEMKYSGDEASELYYSCICHKKLAWEMHTPFGTPVDPDEQAITATFSAPFPMLGGLRKRIEKV